MRQSWSRVSSPRVDAESVAQPDDACSRDPATLRLGQRSADRRSQPGPFGPGAGLFHLIRAHKDSGQLIGRHPGTGIGYGGNQLPIAAFTGHRYPAAGPGMLLCQ
jgi:hypothetical protein